MLVVLGDVDAAGVLYFATVYRWHESTFTNWLAEHGIPLEQILSSGRGLPVRTSWADYPSAARLGDDVRVTRSIAELTETDFVFETTWRDAASGRVVATVSTKHVACERDAGSGLFWRTPIWESLRSALLALTNEG
ncbi:hypothetical protein GCM10009749_29930 [Agromyces neolithicus]|uniref:Acyl-CoA thioesterase n=1 Tax=Agromyces neolithicus TaxID=269420 RepID=A0ABN2MAV7_9MICO